MGVFMGEIIDFDTGLPIKPQRPVRRDDTVEAIQCLYQRRSQFSSVLFVAINKTTGEPIITDCSFDPYELSRMLSAINTYAAQELRDYRGFVSDLDEDTE